MNLLMLILLATLTLVTGCAPRECWLPNSNYTCQPFSVPQ